MAANDQPPPGPLYRRIHAVLRRRIDVGEWPPNSAMPSEHALAGEFGASRVSIRKALDVLEAEGAIVRQRGRGVFVRDARPTSPKLTFSGRAEDVADIEAGTTVTVLRYEEQPLPDTMAHESAEPPGEPWLRIDRVRSVADGPFSMSETYVPRRLAHALDRTTLGNRTTLSILEHVGVRAYSADQSLSAVAAEVAEADALRVGVGAPLIRVLRVVREKNRAVIEIVRVLYRPDRFDYRVSMMRGDADTGTAPGSLANSGLGLP